MKIRVGFEMIYDFPQPTPLITVLGTHFARASDDRRGRDACGVEDGRHDVDHVRWLGQHHQRPCGDPDPILPNGTRCR